MTITIALWTLIPIIWVVLVSFMVFRIIGRSFTKWDFAEWCVIFFLVVLPPLLMVLTRMLP